MTLAAKGVDIRASSGQIVFRASLKDSTGANLSTGTTLLRIFSVQDNGNIFIYDWSINSFVTAKTVQPTQDYQTMVQQDYKDLSGATQHTGVWTYALSTLGGFTASGVYICQVTNSGATPASQEREIQFGNDQGDQVAQSGDSYPTVLTLATSTQAAAIKAKTDQLNFTSTSVQANLFGFQATAINDSNNGAQYASAFDRGFNTPFGQYPLVTVLYYVDDSNPATVDVNGIPIVSLAAAQPGYAPSTVSQVNALIPHAFTYDASNLPLVTSENVYALARLLAQSPYPISLLPSANYNDFVPYWFGLPSSNPIYIASGGGGEWILVATTGPYAGSWVVCDNFDPASPGTVTAFRNDGSPIGTWTLVSDSSNFTVAAIPLPTDAGAVMSAAFPNAPNVGDANAATIGGHAAVQTNGKLWVLNSDGNPITGNGSDANVTQWNGGTLPGTVAIPGGPIVFLADAALINGIIPTTFGGSSTSAGFVVATDASGNALAQQGTLLAVPAAVWQDATAGHFTVPNSIGASLGGSFTALGTAVFTTAALANAPSGGAGSPVTLAASQPLYAPAKASDVNITVTTTVVEG